MKSEIHPKYVMSTVTCACGNTFLTRSVKPEIKLDICSACHPFFTGKQRMLDTAGRVEQFQKRFSSTKGKMVERKLTPAKTTKTTVPSVRRNFRTKPVTKLEDVKAAKAAKKAEKKAAPKAAAAPKAEAPAEKK